MVSTTVYMQMRCMYEVLRQVPLVDGTWAWEWSWQLYDDQRWRQRPVDPCPIPGVKIFDDPSKYGT